jgi:hypothetical protein
MPELRNSVWNAVIVSEGYRSDEMAQFATDAKQFADALLLPPHSIVSGPR